MTTTTTAEPAATPVAAPTTSPVAPVTSATPAATSTVASVAPVTTAPVQAPAPEAVYEVALADGSLLKPADLTAFLTDAKAAGLTPAQAKSEWSAREKTVASHHQALEAQWTAQTQAWTTAAKADPEIGGTKWASTELAMKRAMDRFATPALRAELDTTGMGNHPELVRILSRVGAAMGEDNMIGVTAGQPGQKSDAAILKERYPSMA